MLHIVQWQNCPVFKKEGRGVCVCVVWWVGQSKVLGLEVKHQPPKQESTRPQWLCECTRLSGRCNLKRNCVPFSHAQICDVIFIVSRFTEWVMSVTVSCYMYKKVHHDMLNRHTYINRHTYVCSITVVQFVKVNKGYSTLSCCKYVKVKAKS